MDTNNHTKIIIMVISNNTRIKTITMITIKDNKMNNIKTGIQEIRDINKNTRHRIEKKLHKMNKRKTFRNVTLQETRVPHKHVPHNQNLSQSQLQIKQYKKRKLNQNQ